MAKKVIVNAKFPNIKPAHKAFQSAQGEGTSYRAAIGRALDTILDRPGIKGKRGLMPFTLTVEDGSPPDEKE